MRNEFKDLRLGEERALYGVTHADVLACRFEGEEDGESALKECRDLQVHNCLFALRYPLWHTKEYKVTDCRLTDTCRAPLWYCELGTLRHCRVEGVKALRECADTVIEDSVISSDEFGWKCRKTVLRRTDVTTSYLFLDSTDVCMYDSALHGKYSFQYTENVTVERCRLDTKDAFWHAKNVTVVDSVVKGEYLGWYSENLTLINCHIIGTQPFCYCRGLRLENCTTEGCDLAFEYSEVDATVRGHIDSVKNPKSGVIRADSIGSVIREGSVIESDCEILTGASGS